MLPLEGAALDLKIKYCETIFDFKQEDKARPALEEAKDKKREVLLQLIALVEGESAQKNILIQQMLPRVFAMIETNMFRTPKVQTASLSGSAEEHLDTKKDEEEAIIMLEEQWPHLQIVYELLLRIIIAKDLDCK